MNKPKTIADLDFNWIFTIEDRKFVYWELDFYWKNPCVENHKIKPENYVFEINIIIDKDVRLRESMYLIHDNIRKIYTEEFVRKGNIFEGACFRLIFSNAFVIKVE